LQEQLASRFCELWVRSAGADVASVWAELRQHYQESHRHYHNLNHLAHCLDALDNARAQIQEPGAVEMAIWFHDVIYQYGAKDNEALSAALFRELAAATMSVDFIDRVCDLILATRHVGVAADTETAFMVDIDLSGFGLPWEGYLADSMALRKEAPDSSDEQYYEGKLRFLNELLAWPRIFQTDYFNKLLEDRARANISRFIRDLRSKGFAVTL